MLNIYIYIKIIDIYNDFEIWILHDLTFLSIFVAPKHRKFKCLDRFRLVARHQVAVPATLPQLRDSPKCQEDTCRPPW